MVGRAKASGCYTLARKKLSALSSSVKMGGLLEWPEGQIPGGDVFRADPADHRFTLFEFWASWCIPCREQNPEWNINAIRYGVEFIPYNILVESSGRVTALEITPDELAKLLESELN